MIKNRLKNYEVKSIRKDLVFQFGDQHDGAIEFAGIVDRGIIDVGYFYGDSKPKNIIAVSTQVGCPSKCSFCELGHKPFIRNLTSLEIYEQVVMMLKQANEYGFGLEKLKHKVNYAKSGEPLLNPAFLEGLEKIAEFDFSYKVSTVFPKGNLSLQNFYKIADFASHYPYPVQMQVSLISTSENWRQKKAGIELISFDSLRKAAGYWRGKNPGGRKINLSLILTNDNPVNVNEVCRVFPPELFRFRFRNYVPTEHGDEQKLEVISEEKFQGLLLLFKEKGYEVNTLASPTPIEMRFNLAANVTLNRYEKMICRKY